ncbi:hypothetical protein Scep_029818 [Stephania cephalantha]|uniref:Uncharacterized protein n=1 Tax=Stephania cephalantha TaxID=152367 RepID=A0AAP0E214_9MAGN
MRRMHALGSSNSLRRFVFAHLYPSSFLERKSRQRGGNLLQNERGKKEAQKEKGKKAIKDEKTTAVDDDTSIKRDPFGFEYVLTKEESTSAKKMLF